MFPGAVAASFKVNYVQPEISEPPYWRDVYRRDPKGNEAGWTRYGDDEPREFNAEGLLVLEKDAKGRVLSGAREGRTLLLVVEAPARLTGDLRQLASQVEPVVREQFRAEPYAALKLRVQRPAAGSPADRGDFVEVQFDPRGRELRG